MVLSSATVHFPELSKLTIISGTRNPYTFPFHYLPKLRHLRIDATVSPVYDTSALSLRGLASLENLELVRCEKLDVRWVEQVVGHLEAGRRWSTFRRLDISDCEDTNADMFNFLPREKLTFNPCVSFSQFCQSVPNTVLIYLFNPSYQPYRMQARARTSFSVLTTPDPQMTGIVNLLAEPNIGERIRRAVARVPQSQSSGLTHGFAISENSTTFASSRSG